MKHLLLLLFFIIGVRVTYAQDQAKPFSAIEIKKMADDKKFIFKAKQATLNNDSENRNGGLISSVPSKLSHVILNGTYSALLTPDSVVSYLPYFGKPQAERVDTENINVMMDESPAKFSTTAYDYEVQQKKKGNVIITVKPKDTKVIEKYVFEFALDGTAKLELTITGYKTIKYDGSFTAL